MLYPIHLPEHYVVVRASVSGGGELLGDCLRAYLLVVEESDSVEILDEEQVNEAGDLIGLVFKILKPLPPEKLARLVPEMEAMCGHAITARLINGVSPPELCIDTKDLSVAYFRREFAVDCSMLHHAESCVRLTHLPTGTTARSTTHRSRVRNHTEALFLLESVVRSNLNAEPRK
uniref:peptide chain release factor family protein n=1 Tax=unclassified Variovorax TaxID=663243 RepID=UPI000D349C4C